MPFAGPINAPAALSLIAAVRIRFMEAYAELYKGKEYSDYEKFIFNDDPAGDLTYTIYAEPMRPMRAWYGDRPMSSTDFQYWTQAVRTFGDGMELDVDDLKDDANPAKRAMYMETAVKFAEAAAGLWPSLVVQALVNGVSSIWLPDGQKIFDLHQYSPSNSSLGTFRNYYANSVQGGSAAYALTYGNLLAALKAGLGFKAPTGLDYPVHYTHLAVAPGASRAASRLVAFDRLPSYEAAAGVSTSAGGDVLNEIKQSYAPEVVEIANMPTGCWALIDASRESEKPLALKKRQEVTWQYTSGGNINGMPVSDDGLVTEQMFNSNKAKYGPKARGEAFFKNWWRVAFFDGNSSPVTSLTSIVG